MSCDIFKPLLMGYLDEELTALENSRVEQHLQDCQECTTDLTEFRKLKEFTRNMRVAMPDDRYWEEYWSNVYNRLERRTGWILISLGSIILGAYILWRIIDEALFDLKLPLLVRMGLLALVAGLCTLIVSVIRERFFLLKRDKYERIKR